MTTPYPRGIPYGPQDGQIADRVTHALRRNAQRAHDGVDWHIFGSRNRRIWAFAESCGPDVLTRVNNRLWGRA